jgi:hypothetical protein
LWLLCDYIHSFICIKHGLWMPNEVVFHWNPDLLGLGRQIGQINSGTFGIFSAKLYSESKRKTITNAHFMTISGHFSTNCIFIFHKNEVQTVILRCLMGLSLDWFKSYGLRCRWRPHACLANFQKIATDKWPFYYHIWPFFCQLYVYLSQNWDSDGHFEVLN